MLPSDPPTRLGRSRREPCRPAVRRRPLGGKSLRRGGHDL